MIRRRLEELRKELDRRSFLRIAAKGVGIGWALDRFGERVFANADPETAFRVFSALGNLVVPEDHDPGWITFDPDITEYGLNFFARQVMLSGNEAAFEGLLAALNALHQLPPSLDYGPPFLEMVDTAQILYFSDILTGAFENDGVQDILGLAGGVSLITAKSVFFCNFPFHRAIPNAEYQVRQQQGVRAGWDIMGFKGPVGPEEEQALRDRFFDAEEIPGVDFRNPFI
jgi:hypothetical protein